MWSAVRDGNEYSVRDHNDAEQARLSADGGISTQDVRGVMHDRCSALKQSLQRGGGSSPIDMAEVLEYFTILEDMAGNQIELPNDEP